MPIGNPRWPPSWKSIFCFFSWTKWPIDFKLARKHRGDLKIKNSQNCADWKSKMAAILKIYFLLLLLNRKANWLQTCWEALWWLVDQKQLKSCRSEIQDGRHGGHLENLVFASSPEPKGQLTSNLLGSIGVTCRSKIAKIMPIGNPRWPPWPPSWKSIFRFFSWT